MAKWLRPLNFSAPNRPLAVGQGFFLGDLLFLPHLTIGSAQNE